MVRLCVTSESPGWGWYFGHNRLPVTQKSILSKFPKPSILARL